MGPRCPAHSASGHGAFGQVFHVERRRLFECPSANPMIHARWPKAAQDGHLAALGKPHDFWGFLPRRPRRPNCTPGGNYTRLRIGGGQHRPGVRPLVAHHQIGGSTAADARSVFRPKGWDSIAWAMPQGCEWICLSQAFSLPFNLTTYTGRCPGLSCPTPSESRRPITTCPAPDPRPSSRRRVWHRRRGSGRGSARPRTRHLAARRPGSASARSPTTRTSDARE